MDFLEDFFRLYMPHRVCITNLWILVPYFMASVGTGIVYLVFIPAALSEQLQKHGLDSKPSDVKLARFVMWCGLNHIGAAVMIFFGAYGILTLIMSVMLYVSIDFYLYIRQLRARGEELDVAGES